MAFTSGDQGRERPGFAEFFAGIGLVRVALASLGWRCVFANDIDPKKAEMYRQNFPADELLVDDVYNLNVQAVPESAELWTASFPCVDLSLAGWRRGIHGQHSGAYWGFAQLLEAAYDAGRPPLRLFLENVVGLATSGGGDDLAKVLEELSGLGYTHDVVVVDAKFFTPQSRPRLFIVAEQQALISRRLLPVRPTEFDSALRPAVVHRFISEHPSLNWGYLPLESLPDSQPCLESIIEALSDDDPRWWSREAVEKLLDSMSDLNAYRVDKMLASLKPEYGTVYRRVRSGQTMAELRRDGLAGCLRTARGGSSKQFLLQTRAGQIRARALTIRECARLQGVKDSFRLDVPTNQAWFGLGDAVCVPAVKWLAQQFCPADSAVEMREAAAV